MRPSLAILRWVLILFIVILFAVFQLLSQGSSWAGGACVRSLADPDEDAQAAYVWTGIGYPLQYVSITEAGCFEDRTTTVEWRVGALLVDILVFAGVGVILYGIVLGWQRFRRRDASEKEGH